MRVLVNVDVPDLEAGLRFYTEGLGLQVGRRLEEGFVELLGAQTPTYLLLCAPDSLRHYSRPWCPVHMDFVVEDRQAAVSRAVTAGAVVEREPRLEPYGWLAVLEGLR